MPSNDQESRSNDMWYVNVEAHYFCEVISFLSQAKTVLNWL